MEFSYTDLQAIEKDILEERSIIRTEIGHSGEHITTEREMWDLQTQRLANIRVLKQDYWEKLDNIEIPKL